MNKHIQSQIRHWLTALAGLGGLLATNRIIAPDQVEVINDAGAAIIEPVSAAGAVIAAGLARLLMATLNAQLRKRGITFFTSGTGKYGGNGTMTPAFIGLCAAAALMGGLPSCTTTTAPDGTVTRAPDHQAIEESTGFARWLYDTFSTERERASGEASTATEVTATK